ncbi:hypothetical protein MPL3356_110345 [Mesorhizobium plurifarium]|uniref:Uncharacterized protein n=1 Tax=Mesorhizobium plurifarium TaxID=69974 RepID=A0A090DG41_MESPL|nr:hypothetical protein MPL3356_110345 [Mesorhizobium plurifarium]
MLAGIRFSHTLIGTAPREIRRDHREEFDGVCRDWRCLQIVRCHPGPAWRQRGYRRR